MLAMASGVRGPKGGQWDPPSVRAASWRLWLMAAVAALVLGITVGALSNWVDAHPDVPLAVLSLATCAWLGWRADGILRGGRHRARLMVGDLAGLGLVVALAVAAAGAVMVGVALAVALGLVARQRMRGRRPPLSNLGVDRDRDDPIWR